MPSAAPERNSRRNQGIFPHARHTNISALQAGAYGYVTKASAPHELVEAVRLLIQGLSVKDIAKSMGLNSKTMANHQAAIRQKLGADTAIQLLRKADQLGLGSPLAAGRLSCNS